MKIVLDEGAYVPERGHSTDAGLDLRTPKRVVVPTEGSAVVDTGIHMEIPNGAVGMLKSKSGLNIKHGITSEGVIDVGYTGSIVVKLYNHGSEDVVFEVGDKITQIIIMPIIIPSEIEVVESLGETERGSSGFGSTGS